MTQASDVWFGLGSIAAVNAFWIVATFNRSLIKNWHYFISLRMMAVASLSSFLFYFLKRELSAVYSYRYLLGAIFVGCVASYCFGYILDLLHKPPSPTTLNARFASIQAYSDKICRSTTGWKAAILATLTIGAFSAALIIIIPPQWATAIPLAAIGFEVSKSSQPNSSRLAHALSFTFLLI